MSRGPEKEQLHSQFLKIWNFRGSDDFSNFNPQKILSGDNWGCVSEVVVLLDSAKVFLRDGDVVIALVDDPGGLTKVNIDAGKWKIFRHLTNDEVQKVIDLFGETLAIKSEFSIDTTPTTGNYNTTTKHLTVADFSETPFLTGDNINLWVNGIKYTLAHFDFQPDDNYIVWIPANVGGWDINHDDFIEIEVFRSIN